MSKTEYVVCLILVVAPVGLITGWFLGELANLAVIR